MKNYKEVSCYWRERLEPQKRQKNTKLRVDRAQLQPIGLGGLFSYVDCSSSFHAHPSPTRVTIQRAVYLMEIKTHYLLLLPLF